MPRVPVAGGAALVWVGAHGGAGTDALAALLPGSLALSGAWPEPDLDPAVPVVLVARTSAGALQAAARATTQWAAGGVPQVDLLGLVLVADRPGRLPGSCGLQELVAGGAPPVLVAALGGGVAPRRTRGPRDGARRAPAARGRAPAVAARPAPPTRRRPPGPRRGRPAPSAPLAATPVPGGGPR